MYRRKFTSTLTDCSCDKKTQISPREVWISIDRIRENVRDPAIADEKRDPGYDQPY